MGLLRTAILGFVALSFTAPLAAADKPVFEAPPFVVPEGFVVELVAAPPLVQHPIMGGFDERGRLFLAENAGMNLDSAALLEQLPNSVTTLEDTDGDGTFDTSRVFADKMTFPQGAAWYRGALYVASPPSIWRLEDTDGDGTADRRDEIVSKFGFTGNAADVHGCFVGPDGRIYWCDGRHGHEFEESPSRVASKGLAARVFSCRPDGSDARVFCGGGMDNPVEIAFTAQGDVLGTMTFYNPDDDRHDALVHFVHGGVYPKKHPCTEEFKRTGDLMPAVSRFGVVAPSGLCIYRGGQFGEEYFGNAFSVQFNTHKVVRHVLTREGATFRSHDEDFLVSTSPDFHPTDVLEDADGSLLVIDTGGWFRIGCPTSQVAKPDILGGIYRIRRADAPAIDDPRGLKLEWAQATPSDLVERLSDARPAVAERAIDELAMRGDDAVDAIGFVMNGQSSPAARQRAVWALCRIGTDTAKFDLAHALADPDPGVRQAAATALGTAGGLAAIDDLKRVVADDEPAVRREAAMALGRTDVVASSVPTLLAALSTAEDRFVEHALIYALIEVSDSQATQAGLADSSPAVRRGALIALDQMDEGGLTRELVAPLLDTDDLPLRQAALDVIGRREGWADQITGLVTEWIDLDRLSLEQETMLKGALASFKTDQRLQSLVGEALSRAKLARGTRLLLLDFVARSELAPPPESWLAAIAAGLAAEDSDVVRQSVSAAASVGGGRFNEVLRQLGGDSGHPVDVRVAAWLAYAKSGLPLDDATVHFLSQRVGEDAPPLERLSAAAALSDSTLTGGQLTALTDLVGRTGPLELPVLAGAFEKSNDAAVGLAFVEDLGRSPGLSSLTAARLEQILAGYPPQVRESAGPVLARIEADRTASLARIDEFASAIDGGDPARGREVFAGRAASCTACHRVSGEGGAIGPDLSKIGEVRTRRDLLEAVLLPSLSFARGYESYSIATDGGEVHTGVVSRETPQAIYLRTTQQTEIKVSRASIDEMGPATVSVMPQGLEKTISRQDLADLLAYLDGLE